VSGRPKGQRPCVAFRLKQSIFEALKAASEFNSRSLSEEAAYRLELTFELDRARAVNFETRITELEKALANKKET
jgi:hypothetical protein